MKTFVAEVGRRLDNLRASQNFLAGYIGISSGRMSMCLNGDRPLDSELMGRMRAALTELEELSQMFKPLSLDFRDAAAVKSVIHGPMNLPKLFAVIGNAQSLKLSASELTAVNAIAAVGDQLEEDIEKIQSDSQALFTAWLNETSVEASQ
jgi:hypothetical protein